MTLSRSRSVRMPVFAAMILAICAAVPAIANPVGYWRQAYESSPAAYQPITHEALQKMAEATKLPLTVLEQMDHRTMATGTLRFHAVVTAGGSEVRIRLSNEEGTAPLVISGASVGVAADGFDVRPGTLKPVTFSGAGGISIPAGTPVLSDAVPLAVSPGTELVISIYLKGQLEFDARGLALIAEGPGDQTLSDTLQGRKDFSGRPLVTGIDVFAPQPVHVIAVLGDSLSDSNRPQVKPFKSWPEFLADRLNARKTGGTYAVVNAGIAGNQLFATAAGAGGLSRLDRDVLQIHGLSYIILLEGENDIGMSGHTLMAGENPPLTAQDLIAGYRQVIARAHIRGIKVAIATMLPFGGAPTHYTPEHDQVREAVNQWIRTSHEPDAVIDFEKVARDPNTPSKLAPAFDSGDHLHPGEAGFKALAASIDLSIFP